MSGRVIDPGLGALATACLAGVRGQRAPDHPALPALAVRHRVSGLVAAANGDRQGVERAIEASLRHLSDCQEIGQTLAGLDLMFLKGLAVSGQGYAQPLLKTSADIDILVPKSALHEAAKRLSDLGYVRHVPRTATSLRRWHEVSNQSVWMRGGTVVELHHRPIPYRLLDGLSSHSRTRQVVDVAGVQLPTFDPLDTFAYLVAHGTLSGWFRLKWLVDVAALLDTAEFDVDSAVEHARRLAVGDAAAGAIGLCGLVFSRPEFLSNTRGETWRTHRLVSLALGLLERGEPTEWTLGTLPIHASALLMTGTASLGRWRDLVAQRQLA